MAMRGVNFKWYDGFFLSMLATSVVIVSINWRRYRLCAHPLHIWIVIDYTAVFLFRMLMFLDNGLAAGMGLSDLYIRALSLYCSTTEAFVSGCSVLLRKNNTKPVF